MPVKRMAPESLKSNLFNQKTDVWSYGIVLFEIFTFGDVPFRDVVIEDSVTAFTQVLEKGYILRLPDTAPTFM